MEFGIKVNIIKLVKQVELQCNELVKLVLSRCVLVSCELKRQKYNNKSPSKDIKKITFPSNFPQKNQKNKK